MSCDLSQLVSRLQVPTKDVKKSDAKVIPPRKNKDDATKKHKVPKADEQLNDGNPLGREPWVQSATAAHKQGSGSL